MNNKLSLLEYCRKCENLCCEGYTAPYIHDTEREEISAAFEVDGFVQEGDYCIPRKEDNKCVFLYQGLCKLEIFNPKFKPVDCKIFPFGPMLDTDYNIEWTLFMNCPAAEHLTPEFYANAVILGTEWIKKTDSKAFMAYWDKHVENNPEQDLVLLKDYLASKPEPFLEQIRKSLGQKMVLDPIQWLKNNKSESLAKILKSSEIKIF